MKYVMNKNVTHDGIYMEKGSECPEKFGELMLKNGHADLIKEEPKKEEPKKEEPKKEEKKKKGKW